MVDVKTFGYRKPRFQASFGLWLQTQGQDCRSLSARCYDIGEDGIGADLTEELTVGQQVIFLFTLPRSNTSWHVRAQVINRKGEHHGFVFLYATEGEKEFVREFIARLRSQKIMVIRRPGTP